MNKKVTRMIKKYAKKIIIPAPALKTLGKDFFIDKFVEEMKAKGYVKFYKDIKMMQICDNEKHIILRYFEKYIISGYFVYMGKKKAQETKPFNRGYICANYTYLRV